MRRFVPLERSSTLPPHVAVSCPTSPCLYLRRTHRVATLADVEILIISTRNFRSRALTSALLRSNRRERSVFSAPIQRIGEAKFLCLVYDTDRIASCVEPAALRNVL